jgi:hypothetical protein
MSKNLMLILVLLAGCAEAPPIKATINVLSFKAKEQQPKLPAGIEAGIGEVTPTNIAQRKLEIKVHWKNADPNQVRESVSNENEGTVPIVPMPTFIVRIINKSGKPLSFDKAKIVLADSSGKTFPAILEIKEVVARVEGQIVSLYSALEGNDRVLGPLRDAIAKMPFATTQSQVAPGADWEGFVAVKMDDLRDLEEIDKYMKGVESLSLKLDNLMLAGAPIALSFDFVKFSAPVKMTCPGDLKEPPSIAKCKPEPAP